MSSGNDRYCPTTYQKPCNYCTTMVARLLFVASKWHTASNRRVFGSPPGPTVGHEHLLRDYGRAREGNERSSDRLQEVKMENKALRGTVANFERIKRARPGGSGTGRGGRKAPGDARAGAEESKAEVRPRGKVTDSGRALQGVPSCFMLVSRCSCCYN